MYQGTKIAIKNAPLLGIFQSAKTCNLWALLARSESALLGICVAIEMKNIRVKDNLTTPSRLSLRAM